MASEVEICNRALQKVGAKRIVSLTEDSPQARACNVAYGPVRDRLLRAHTWNFSIKRAQLAADSSGPAFGRDNSYPLPSDFLRLLPKDPHLVTNNLDWQIEGRKIVTNDDSPLDVRYVSRVTDPNQMDPLFREALSSDLALELCEELTQSKSKRDRLERERIMIIQEARRINAMENVSAEPPPDEWITVRA